MDQPSLYDDDIVTWAERQAVGLRELAHRPELSNILDWESIAEEIESVGRSQIDAVEHTLLQVLVHVLKYLSAPSAQSSRSWRTEVLAFHATARRRYKSSMRQRIDCDGLWESAVAQAGASLAIYGDSLVVGLPEGMPFTPDELVGAAFDMDWALTRLAAALEKPADRH